MKFKILSCHTCDENIYDFHGLGFGSAYIACWNLLKHIQQHKIPSIKIIIGQGKHSTNGRPVVGRAMDLLLESLNIEGKIVELTFPYPNNPGLIELHMLDNHTILPNITKSTIKYNNNALYTTHLWNVIHIHEHISPYPLLSMFHITNYEHEHQNLQPNFEIHQDQQFFINPERLQHEQPHIQQEVVGFLMNMEIEPNPHNYQHQQFQSNEEIHHEIHHEIDQHFFINTDHFDFKPGRKIIPQQNNPNILEQLILLSNLGSI